MWNGTTKKNKNDTNTRRTTRTSQSQQSQPFVFRNSDTTIRNILTNTRTIALVGASDKVERPSNEVMKILQQEYGYRVIPINPRLKGQMLLGERVLGSLEELPTVLLGKAITAGSSTEKDNDDDDSDIGGGVMVDIFRRSDGAGEIVDQAIALGAAAPGNLNITSIWMQIGVIDDQAAQRAMDAGLAVAMNVCPAEEIPRLGISVPGDTTMTTLDDTVVLPQDNKKPNSRKHHNDVGGSTTKISSTKRTRRT